MMIDHYEGESVTGLLFHFWRELIGQENVVRWKLIERQVKDVPPPAFDVEPILLRWWGVQQAQADLTNAQKEQAWRQDLDALVVADQVPPAPPPPAPPGPISAPPPPSSSSSTPSPLTFSQMRAIKQHKIEAPEVIQEHREEEIPPLKPVKASKAANGTKKRAPRRKKGGAS